MLEVAPGPLLLLCQQVSTSYLSSIFLREAWPIILWGWGEAPEQQPSKHAQAQLLYLFKFCLFLEQALGLLCYLHPGRQQSTQLWRYLHT